MRKFILFLMLTVLTLGLYSQPVQVGTVEYSNLYHKATGRCGSRMGLICQSDSALLLRASLGSSPVTVSFT